MGSDGVAKALDGGKRTRVNHGDQGGIWVNKSFTHCCSRRPHTVKHVGSKSDCNNNVFGVALFDMASVADTLDHSEHSTLTMPMTYLGFFSGNKSVHVSTLTGRKQPVS